MITKMVGGERVMLLSFIVCSSFGKMGSMDALLN